MIRGIPWIRPGEGGRRVFFCIFIGEITVETGVGGEGANVGNEGQVPGKRKKFTFSTYLPSMGGQEASFGNFLPLIFYNPQKGLTSRSLSLPLDPTDDQLH